MAASIDLWFKGENWWHGSTLGFIETINSGLITIMHTGLFDIDEGRSSGEVNDKIAFGSDWADPLVEEVFVDGCIFLMNVHFQIESIVKSNIVFKLMFQSGDSQNVIDKSHQIGLFIGAEGWVDSCEVHWGVEGDVFAVEEVVPEEISVNNDVLGDGDLITEASNCGLA